MIGRRTWLWGLPALGLSPLLARAEPSTAQRKLANRIELWSNYARRSRNLMARVSTRRETSLLEEPLLSTGTLVFREPGLVVLRDDGRQGSTTLIDGDAIRVFLNGEGRTGPSTIVADTRPAARWMAQRLVAAFAPGDGTALVEDCRASVPKGRGYRLELLPPRGSATRRQIRSLTLHLDPVAGSITQLSIAETQGDRVVIALSDHRQDLPDEDIDAFIEQLDR
ncbi:MAG: hypothetical protein K0V04_26025 [Deltaproteobacteria bacterium]|nr:hypothetical protein [Deltaproteobacteria bacterium]